MIVDRRTFNVKRGCLEELLTLVKAEQERIRQQYSYTHALRNYTPLVAPFGTLVIEGEWESLADYEKFWNEWPASPEGSAFMKKWSEMLEHGGTHEIWELVDQTLKWLVSRIVNAHSNPQPARRIGYSKPFRSVYRF